MTHWFSPSQAGGLEIQVGLLKLTGHPPLTTLSTHTLANTPKTTMPQNSLEINSVMIQKSAQRNGRFECTESSTQ